MTSTFSFLRPWTDSFAYKDSIGDMVLWKPHASSRSNWVTKTGLPFDPFESAAVLLHQDLLCPKCKVVVSVREYTDIRENSRVFYTRPAYITSAGTGYAQQNFSHACSSCIFEITREKLAVAKLTIDLTAHLLHEPQRGVTDMQLLLP